MRVRELSSEHGVDVSRQSTSGPTGSDILALTLRWLTLTVNDKSLMLWLGLRTRSDRDQIFVVFRV